MTNDVWRMTFALYVREFFYLFCPTIVSNFKHQCKHSACFCYQFLIANRKVKRTKRNIHMTSKESSLESLTIVRGGILMTHEVNCRQHSIETNFSSWAVSRLIICNSRHQYTVHRHLHTHTHTRLKHTRRLGQTQCTEWCPTQLYLWQVCWYRRTSAVPESCRDAFYLSASCPLLFLSLSLSLSLSLFCTSQRPGDFSRSSPLGPWRFETAAKRLKLRDSVSWIWRSRIRMQPTQPSIVSRSHWATRWINSAK